MTPPPPRSPLFPYTTLFRSPHARRQPEPALLRVLPAEMVEGHVHWPCVSGVVHLDVTAVACWRPRRVAGEARSEEHTSELQSHSDLVCRLLLEKKKKMISDT